MQLCECGFIPIMQKHCANVPPIVRILPHSNQAYNWLGYMQIWEYELILIEFYNCVNVTPFWLGYTIVWIWHHSK